MAKTDFKTIADYIGSLPDAESKAGIREIAAAIQRAVPQAESVISYQLPAFRTAGGWIFYISAHKAHYSLSCPPPYPAYAEFKTELAKYEKSKSALKLPKSEKLPMKLIEKMAAHHAKVNAEQAAKKPAAKPAKKKPKK